MRAWAALFLCLATPISGSAQSVGHDLENGIKDITYIWTAPARINRSALAPLGALTAGTTALVLVDEPLFQWLSTHDESFPVRLLRPLRDGELLSLLGRSYVLSAGSAALYAAGWASDSRDLRHAGVGCISAAVSTTLSRSLITHVIGRLRPSSRKGAFVVDLFVSDWEQLSFPGGHVSHVMSCVSFWNNRFDLDLAEPALYILSTGIGWARVVDGAHWPSDTLVGQVFGWSVGKGVADRYLGRDRVNQIELPSARLMLRVAINF